MLSQPFAVDLQLLMKLEQIKQKPTATAAGKSHDERMLMVAGYSKRWLMRGQAFAADLERLFGELEQMEPELTVVTGRGGQDMASVSLDETRVNRVILQARRDFDCSHSAGITWWVSLYVQTACMRVGVSSLYFKV